MKHFSRILPFVAAFAIIGGSIVEPVSSSKAAALKSPKAPVAAAEKKGSFDITEFKANFQVEAGGTSKGGDVPVTPGIMAGGKTGDVVITGMSGGGTGDVVIIG